MFSEHCSPMGIAPIPYLAWARLNILKAHTLCYLLFLFRLHHEFVPFEGKEFSAWWNHLRVSVLYVIEFHSHVFFEFNRNILLSTHVHPIEIINDTKSMWGITFMLFFVHLTNAELRVRIVFRQNPFDINGMIELLKIPCECFEFQFFFRFTDKILDSWVSSLYNFLLDTNSA